MVNGCHNLSYEDRIQSFWFTTLETRRKKRRFDRTCKIMTERVNVTHEQFFALITTRVINVHSIVQEPTSGLDSAIAQSVISTLSTCSKCSSQIIITTIHQPSSQVFHMFSKILLLTDGQVHCTTQLIRCVLLYMNNICTFNDILDKIHHYLFSGIIRKRLTLITIIG